MVYGGEVATDWYTLFHSDSLNAIVQEALRANPNDLLALLTRGCALARLERFDRATDDFVAAEV